VDGKNGSDVFEITAVDDTADTVNVTPSPNSVTAGVTWAIGGAFANIQRTMVVASAGDTNYLKGTFDEAVDMTAVAAVGAAATTPITWAGYTTTPGDGGLVVLDSNNTKTNAWVVGSGSGTAFWIFKNIRITRYTNMGFRNLGSGDPILFIDCRVDNCGGIGFWLADLATCIRCAAVLNGAQGFSLDSHAVFYGCSAEDNADEGFLSTRGMFLFGCTARGNGTIGGATSSGIHQSAIGATDRTYIVNCVVDGEGVTDVGIQGVDSNRAGNTHILNTVVMDCQSIGISAGLVDHGQFNVGMGLLVHGNAAAYERYAALELEVTANPTFVNEGVDYTPAANSPAIGAGWDSRANQWTTVTGHRVHIGIVPPSGNNEDGVTSGGTGTGWGWGD
jgi:hypothetical protein